MPRATSPTNSSTSTFSIDNIVFPKELAGIEVYNGPAKTPLPVQSDVRRRVLRRDSLMDQNRFLIARIAALAIQANRFPRIPEIRK